ncbi:hypothetical protein F5148DRAFT_1151227 [Russula earlei]|uniref:Uncharacterized protein n=1 Tax=Russula earlei TaxID=71964 RepID=A0ACC0U119_9AGAM|nr:hypothetical protein F5148DRAFT_1151227 [Russula earlei]
MSALPATLATTAKKHARTLSRPLRRTFYSPFAALQHSPLLAKPPAANSSSPSASDAAAYEHEREHASRTLYVVSEPNAADFKYGVPAGAYPIATPYHPMVAAGATTYSALENVSSPSLAAAHPMLTRAVPRHATAATGVGRTRMRASSPLRSAPGERCAPGGGGEGEASLGVDEKERGDGNMAWSRGRRSRLEDGIVIAPAVQSPRRRKKNTQEGGPGRSVTCSEQDYWGGASTVIKPNSADAPALLRGSYNIYNYATQ